MALGTGKVCEASRSEESSSPCELLPSPSLLEYWTRPSEPAGPVPPTAAALLSPDIVTYDRGEIITRIKLKVRSSCETVLCSIKINRMLLIL